MCCSYSFSECDKGLAGGISSHTHWNQRHHMLLFPRASLTMHTLLSIAGATSGDLGATSSSLRHHLFAGGFFGGSLQPLSHLQDCGVTVVVIVQPTQCTERFSPGTWHGVLTVSLIPSFSRRVVSPW
jgi:hypothetical protein